MVPRTRRALVFLLSSVLCLPALAQSQGPPPPGAGAANALVRVEYFWQGVSGLTHVPGWYPRNGTLLNNIMGPESVLLTPTLQPVPVQCPGGTNTAAVDLNDGGAIAGFCTARDGTIIGFVRSPTGRYTEVRVPGATRTEAVAVNTRQHVGGDYRSPDGVIHGFIWTGGAKYTSIDLPGSAWTALTGLNTHGEAVGFAGGADDAVHGWLKRGKTITPVDVPGATSTLPVHLNDAREVTGVYVTAAGEFRSFVLTARGYEDVAVPGASMTDVAGMRDGVYWGRYLEPGDTPEMPWLSYGFVARLVPQPLPPSAPAIPDAPAGVAFRSSAMVMSPAGPTLALCERTGGPGTITPGKLLGRQGGCQ